MASWPCFPLEEHRILPVPGYAWTWGAAVAVSFAAVAIALASFLVSRRTYLKTGDETQGDHHHLLETGSGRTRFIALWGMALGAGFAVATAMSTIAFFLLPRCSG